ncbi:MAG: DUF4829 domain-containing protein [Oscillospiraceae bacterium]
MKKFIALFLLLFLLLQCVGKPGKTENVKITLGASSQFSENELQAAANAVLKRFVGFEDCTLTELWYDEGFSNSTVAQYHATKNDPANGIALLSNFDVGPSGGDGSFNPNTTYSHWNWILTRSGATGHWKVIDWGD